MAATFPRSDTPLGPVAEFVEPAPFLEPGLFIVWAFVILVHPILLASIRKAAGRTLNSKDVALTILLAIELFSSVSHLLLGVANGSLRFYDSAKINSSGEITPNTYCKLHVVFGGAVSILAWVGNANAAYVTRRRVIDHYDVPLSRQVLVVGAMTVVTIGGAGFIAGLASSIVVNFDQVLCLVKQSTDPVTSVLWTAAFLTLVGSAVIVTHSFSKLWLYLKSIRRAAGRVFGPLERDERRTARLIIFLVLSFVLTQLPLMLTELLVGDGRVPGGWIADTVMFLFYLNHLVDGVLVLFVSSRYQRGVKALFEEMWIGKTRLGSSVLSWMWSDVSADGHSDDPNAREGGVIITGHDDARGFVITMGGTPKSKRKSPEPSGSGAGSPSAKVAASPAGP